LDLGEGGQELSTHRRGHSAGIEGLIIIKDGQTLRWQTWAMSGSCLYSPIKVVRRPEGQGFVCYVWDGVNGEKTYSGQTACEAIYPALSRRQRRGLPIAWIFHYRITREKVERLFPDFKVVDLTQSKRA